MRSSQREWSIGRSWARLGRRSPGEPQLEGFTPGVKGGGTNFPDQRVFTVDGVKTAASQMGQWTGEKLAGCLW